MQQGLFASEKNTSTNAPLAHEIRPLSTDDYVGFAELSKRYPFLNAPLPKSMIIWGPPGVGKTTLAHVLCQAEEIEFMSFSAVLSGIAELKKLFARAQEVRELYGRQPVIFIDEIHRFNKAQQDALLPHVESGLFILIGATTENPRSSVNRALLSRLQIIELKSMDYDKSLEVLKKAISKTEHNFDTEELELMAEYSGGDARKAVGNLEMAINLKSTNHYSMESLKSIILENARSYDRNQDRHYDVISAFIKSMRGSDPDAAILWLAVMLDGGEDPVFIARRLVIFASEDVGNADINALTVANNALNVVSQIGMPEARITLAQAATYLASTVKSNAAYKAINEALEFVSHNPTREVPEHLKNFPARNHSVKYKYPHEFDGAFVDQEYAPKDTPQFYRPKDVGVEKNIKLRLEKLWNGKKDYS